jgi:hypothetical protein
VRPAFGSDTVGGVGPLGGTLPPSRPVPVADPLSPTVFVAGAVTLLSVRVTGTSVGVGVLVSCGVPLLIACVAPPRGWLTAFVVEASTPFPVRVTGATIFATGATDFVAGAVAPVAGGATFVTGTTVCVAAFVAGAAALPTWVGAAIGGAAFGAGGAAGAPLPTAAGAAAGGSAFGAGAGALGETGVLAGVLPVPGATTLRAGGAACSTAEEAGLAAAPAAPPIGLAAIAGALPAAAPTRPASVKHSPTDARIARDPTPD